MKAEGKIDMRHPSVNVTMSKLLRVKIVAVTFAILFFMLMFAAQQLIYSQIWSRDSYHISEIFLSLFSG